MRPYDTPYYEAEIKIDRAIKENARSINLSGMNLTVIPESLGNLGGIQSILLHDNNLSSLPEFLKPPPWGIQTLSLNSNNLKTLPNWIGELPQLRYLNLCDNHLGTLPASFERLTSLRELILDDNELLKIPESLKGLCGLQRLTLRNNGLTELPNWLAELKNLQILWLGQNERLQIPQWLGDLTKLNELTLEGTGIKALPSSIGGLSRLRKLDLDSNPLNPELAAAYSENVDAVRYYLNELAAAHIVLNEAKLIVVGEGEVGKTCLIDALLGDPYVDGRPTTHGIEIRPVDVTVPSSGVRITMNCWDFGGQKVYRPTHQLFFSAPAVYLVVWKPREGTQQNLVKEWLQLIKHREPHAKVLIVATHGGARDRQADIDRQELWDIFGHAMVVGFHSVDSKHDDFGARRGIVELKANIATVAFSLPETGREVPSNWQLVRDHLKGSGEAYLPLKKVLTICGHYEMDEGKARRFVRIEHLLGHIVHYENDPVLQDIVVLKPDWLAIAISFVLDDEETRNANGVVSFQRLGQIWNNPQRPADQRYEETLHKIFVRLMEKFDLSYEVMISPRGFKTCVGNQADLINPDYTSLIGQLVPDIRPEEGIAREWAARTGLGFEEQVQICRIVDMKGDTARAEGLFYQLIVRLHKYSLGRDDFHNSVHWQRGLVLDDGYSGRALLEHTGNDVRITVRAAYPERFLSALTYEVSWLVENFWDGLRCPIMVPCLKKDQFGEKCNGLFDVTKLIENKRRNRPEQPCPICNEWQDIDGLLRNAPAARPTSTEELIREFSVIRLQLAEVRPLLKQHHEFTVGRFDSLEAGTQRVLSQVDEAFYALMRVFTDEAKEGPCLFSLVPVAPNFLDRPNWVNEKFRLTLWCEHSRLPLTAPQLNGAESKSGVFYLDIPRDWFVKSAPVFKVIGATLGLVLPVASAATKLALDEATYKRFEAELDFGQKSIESVLEGSAQVEDWLGKGGAPDVEHGTAIEASGAMLRQLHSWLKEKDPGFGGLVRVQNKKQEFLWVHSQFAGEY